MSENEGAAQGSKSWILTFWFSLILGVFGVDRFYLGKWKSGLAKAFTLGGLGFWLLYDLIQVFNGVTQDKDKKKLLGYNSKKRNLNFALGLVWVAWSVSSYIYLQGITTETPRPTATLQASD